MGPIMHMWPVVSTFVSLATSVYHVLHSAAMKYGDLIKLYKSPVNAASALGVSRQVLHNWKIRRAIPAMRQYQIESLSRGKLKADRNDRPV